MKADSKRKVNGISAVVLVPLPGFEFALALCIEIQSVTAVRQEGTHTTAVFVCVVQGTPR